MFSYNPAQFPSVCYRGKVEVSTTTSSEDLKNVVHCIANAERSLVQAEEMVRDMKMNQMDKAGIMGYEMKNKFAVLEHRFVELGELLNNLYLLRRSLKAQIHAVVENTYRELLGLYECTSLVATKKRFPPTGVYVDLDKGTCAYYFHHLVLPAEFCSSEAAELIMGHSESDVNDFLAPVVVPLIDILENYEATLDICDPTVGIYDRKVFEEVHSARWVKTETEDDCEGHYEVKNRIAKAKRHFADLSCVLSILYDLRIKIGRLLDDNYVMNYFGDCNEEHLVLLDKLEYLFENSLYPLKDPNFRFPAEGVFVDLSNGACSVLLIKIMECLHAEKIPPFNTMDDILQLLDDYESYWDDPESGIYDRSHFETHFSAHWIPY